MSLSTKCLDNVEDILCEFFEVVIHNILFKKKLYPETVFTARKKYSTTVYQCIHPGVNEYINQCLRAIQFHSKNNQLKGIFLIIEKDDTVYEKYVFEVLEIRNGLKSDLFLIDLEQNLRAFMLKLHSSQSYLSDLPLNTTFSIKLQTTAYSSLQFNEDPSFEDFAWIEVDETIANSSKSVNIVPIYTVDSSIVHLQIYVEK